MEDFIKEFIEYMIARYKRLSFNVDLVKFVMTTKFNKRSLMYPSIAKNWLKDFFDLIQRLGFGYYDVSSQTLILNEGNQDVEVWKAKYIEKVG